MVNGYRVGTPVASLINVLLFLMYEMELIMAYICINAVSVPD